MNRRTSLPTLATCALALATGCGSVPDRNPIPEELYEDARVIPEIQKARFWGDAPPPWWDELSAMPKHELAEQFSGIYGKEHHYLAISGGGADGAFGAGLLCGWSASGTRPEFTMVTGISTGALTAPFAFLGSEYDHVLKEVFTTLSTKDLMKKRSLLKAITGDSFEDNSGLEAKLAEVVTQEVVDVIAEEGRKGRALLIGTTHLDAERSMIWNVTRIAVSGAPGSLELIRKILLASASVPAAFPPVYFQVDAEGRVYDEMHVDGGVSSQVFLYPADVDWEELIELLEVPGRPAVYLMRNSYVDPTFEAIDPGKLLGIAAHTIQSLIRTQGIGDMYRIYLTAERDGLDFRMTYIPDTFDLKPEEPFDRKYMTALFELGYELAQDGDIGWLDKPWGME